MFDPTIPYTLFTKWRKIQTEQNVLKCGKKLIFLNVRRMFLYECMLESRLSRWTRCCSLSFFLNQLFYVQVDYSYLVLLLFCRGVSSLRSSVCLSYAILICFNFLCSVFSFLVISRTCGVAVLSLRVKNTRRETNDHTTSG